MFKEKTCFFFWVFFCHLIGVFGDDAVKSVSVIEGDPVTLNTNLTELQKDDVIEWRFGTNGLRIAKINRLFDESSTSDDVLDGRFRNRLKLNIQTGSLTIMNTSTTVSGLYEVIIRSSKTTFNVTVNAATPPNTSHPTSSSTSGSTSHPSGSTSHPSGSTSHSSASTSHSSASPSPPPVSVSLIVLISAAAAGFLLIVASVGIFCICRKQRKTNQKTETREEEITYADPIFYKRNKPKSEDEVIYAGVVTRR